MARMYDPVTARFMQEDTYSGDINDPLSLNLYTYVHNEPLMYYDPSGHNWVSDAWNGLKSGYNAAVNKGKEIVNDNIELAKDLYNNPEEVVNAVDQVYLDPAAKAVLGENSWAYKADKYVRTRQEGLAGKTSGTLHESIQSMFSFTKTWQ